MTVIKTYLRLSDGGVVCFWLFHFVQLIIIINHWRRSVKWDLIFFKVRGWRNWFLPLIVLLLGFTIGCCDSTVKILTCGAQKYSSLWLLDVSLWTYRHFNHHISKFIFLVIILHAYGSIFFPEIHQATPSLSGIRCFYWTTKESWAYYILSWWCGWKSSASWYHIRRKVNAPHWKVLFAC